MANWSVLKTAVANIINTNGNQAITGQLLQNVLNNIITNVGENSTFAGIATVDTNPGAPDGPVFYLATTAGIYPNFNAIEVLNGEAVILLWNNGAWVKKDSGFATKEKFEDLDAKIFSLDIKNRDLNGDVISIIASNYGYYSDGKFTESSIYKYTNLIQFRKGVYKAKISGSGAVDKVGVYDKNGVFVKSVKSPDIDVSFEITEDEQYVMFTVSQTSDFILTIEPNANIKEKVQNNSNNIILNGFSADNVFSKGEIRYGFYISDEDGVIKEANSTYKTICVELQKGEYYIKCGNNFEHPIIAKYTDNSYSTLEEIIISDIPAEQVVKTVLKLESGYYAFAYNSNQSVEPVFMNTLDINSFIERTQNAYNESSIEKGKFISIEGIISYGAERMRLVKMYLNNGKYYLSNAGTYHGLLVKYKSNLYQEVEEIYNEDKTNVNRVIELKDGYYALSWDTDIISSNPIFVEVDWLDKYLQYIDEAANRISIQNAMYINADGNIISAASSYSLAKFHIKKTSRYLIGENIYIPSRHAIIAKYADRNFSIFEKFIVRYGVTPIDGLYDLEEGYYAVCSVGGDNIYMKDVKEQLQVSSIAARTSIKDVGGIIGFSQFYDTAGTWEITEDEAISAGFGYNNGIVVRKTTYEDDFIMSSLIEPLSLDEYGNFALAIGRWKASSGTMIKIGNDNGKYASICRVDENGNLLEAEVIDLSSFNIGLNKPIAITIKKSYDSESYISVRLSDSYGNVAEKERVTSFAEKEGGKWNAGLAHGNIAMYAIKGVISFKRFEFGYPKTSDIQIAIIGHSFVEGNNSTVNDKDKRFSALLSSDIGDNKCCIFGLGGGGLGMVEGLKEQVNWLNNLRYAVIMLGANDADTDSNAESYGSFNKYLNDLGIKTIWIAITPLRDGTQAKPIIDAYIRNNFNYVDVNNAFYDENGNIIASMFSDHIHPSKEGYRRMYNIIKTQCSVLWTL